MPARIARVEASAQESASGLSADLRHRRPRGSGRGSHAPRRLPPQARLPPHARARRVGPPARAGGSLRRAEARRAAAALRLPPRARRRAEELGRAEGPEPRSRGEAARRPRRGPSARVRHVRGQIPAGEYGAGNVVLWDRGEWIPEGDPHAGYRQRQAQVRARRREAPRRLDARAHGRAGGRGRQELAPPEGARRDGAPARRRRRPRGAARERRGRRVGDAPEAKLPATLAPQLATLADEPPAGRRAGCTSSSTTAIARSAASTDGQARLFSRSGKDWTRAMSRPVARARARRCRSTTRGSTARSSSSTPTAASSFQALQNALVAGGDGRRSPTSSSICRSSTARDLRALPLVARKQALRGAARARRRATDVLRYADHVDGDGAAFFRQATRATASKASCRSGATRRTRAAGTTDWRKIRCQKRQEFVIGGFTDPGGQRVGLGALLLGRARGRRAPLRRARRHRVRRRDAARAARAPRRARATRRRRSRRPATSPPKGSHFVRPELVAEVAFTEWTGDGQLRHPAFSGPARGQAGAREVVRERPRALPRGATRRRDGRLAGVRLTHPGSRALARGRRHEARARALLRADRRLDAAARRRPAALAAARARGPHGASASSTSTCGKGWPAALRRVRR